MAEPAQSPEIPNRPFDLDKFKALLTKPTGTVEGFRTMEGFLDRCIERHAADEIALAIRHLSDLGAAKNPLGPAYVLYKQLVDHLVGWSSPVCSQDAYDIAIDHWVETFKA